MTDTIPTDFSDYSHYTLYEGRLLDLVRVAHALIKIQGVGR